MKKLVRPSVLDPWVWGESHNFPYKRLRGGDYHRYARPLRSSARDIDYLSVVDPQARLLISFRLVRSRRAL